MSSVLIVEDNKEILFQIKNYLSKEGYDVETASSYNDAINKMDVKIDVCLLDINLSNRDGSDLIDKLKQRNIRIIITTVKNDENFIVKSLDKGVDDYLTKPFSLAVLRARIDAVLRTIPLVNDEKILYKDISINVDTHQVIYKGNIINLTNLEYEILLIFVKNPRMVFTRKRLLELFWDDRDKFVNDNTLTSTIKRIREKTNRDIITTVRGIGYRMD